MDKVQVEDIIDRIYKTRVQIRKLKESVRDDSKLVREYLDSIKKRKLSIGDYSVEMIPMTDKKVDFKILEGLITRGVISGQIIDKNKREVIYIKTKKDIELKGNKFIIK